MTSFASSLIKLSVGVLLMTAHAVAQPGNGGSGPPSTGGGTTTSGTTCPTSAATSEWKIQVTRDDNNRYIKANGCPNYDWSSQSTPNSATEQCHDIQLPLNPKISKTATSIGVFANKDGSGGTPSNIPKGALGISVNGIAFFGNADSSDGDAYIAESATFDQCAGHPQNAGVYHYHAESKPGCVYTDKSGEHSPIFGFMYDGVPIYGSLGDNGVVPTDLDECNGHTDETHKFYHYHVTANFQYPYLTNCLKGCMNHGGASISGVSATSCDEADVQYDYSPIKEALRAESQTSYTCGGTTSTIDAYNGVSVLGSTASSSAAAGNTSGSTSAAAASFAASRFVAAVAAVAVVCAAVLF